LSTIDEELEELKRGQKIKAWWNKNKGGIKTDANDLFLAGLSASTLIKLDSDVMLI